MLLFFTTFLLESIRQKQKVIEKSQIKTYTEEGFYNVLIKGDDIIEILLNEGKDSFFFFIPYEPNFHIQDIQIDGFSVTHPTENGPIGISVEGNDSAILTFNSTVSSIEVNTNLWIIPSNFCESTSAYVYGDHIIDLHFKETEMCIFSPTFDSDDQQFKIEAGMPFNYRDHSTSFYAQNFQIPDFFNSDNTIEKHSFETGTFVKFANSKSSNSISDDHYDADLLFYKRETKIKQSSYQQNKCVVDPVLRCNSKSCTFDVIDVDFIKCNKKGVNVIAIVIASVGSILFIVLLCLILYCVSKKNKKDKTMNTVLLNNDDGNNEYTNNQN